MVTDVFYQFIEDQAVGVNKHVLEGVFALFEHELTHNTKEIAATHWKELWEFFITSLSAILRFNSAWHEGDGTRSTPTGAAPVAEHVEFHCLIGVYGLILF